MDLFCQLIEDRYQAFFQNSFRHPFLEDLEQVRYRQQHLFFKYLDGRIRMISDKMLHSFSKQKNSPPTIQKKYSTPSLEPITSSQLEELYFHIHQSIPERVEELDKLLADLDYSYLPGTILPNQWNFYMNQWKQEQIKKDTFFILILGAGPMGLFTASYIDYMKRRGYFSRTKNVQILLIENRIGDKDGYKLPYTRNRPFQFSTDYFSILLPKLYCSIDRNQQRDQYIRQLPIKHLENMFYLSCYHHKIPMFFTNEYESWNSLSSFMEDIRVDILLDCTGGRFPIPLSTTMKQNQPSWLHKDILLSNDFSDIHWNDQTYRYECIRKKRQGKSLPDNTFYLNIDVQLDNHYYTNETYPIEDKETYLFFENTVKLLGHMSLTQVEQLIPWIPNTNLQKLMVYYVSQLSSYKKRVHFLMFPFEVKMYYRPRVTFPIQTEQNGTTLYVGMGDTNFQSHYILGAGLNRMIPIALYTLHLLPILMYSPKKVNKKKQKITIH
jgi:hypothetical protein